MDHQPHRHPSPDILSEIRVPKGPRQSQTASFHAPDTGTGPSSTPETEDERLLLALVARVANNDGSTTGHDAYDTDNRSQTSGRELNPTNLALLDLMNRTEPITSRLMRHEAAPSKGSAEVHPTTTSHGQSGANVDLGEPWGTFSSAPSLDNSASLLAIGAWGQEQASDGSADANSTSLP